MNAIDLERIEKASKKKGARMVITVTAPSENTARFVVDQNDFDTVVDALQPRQYEITEDEEPKSTDTANEE